MRTVRLSLIAALIASSGSLPALSQDQSSYTRTETHSSSNSTVSGSSSSSNTSTNDNNDGSSGSSSETIRTEKPSIYFAPKFKQRIMDLKDQINLGQSKGFLSSDEVSTFMQRDSQLMSQEEDLARRNYPKPALDDLEKAITLLNGDVFKAMNKKGPPPGPGDDTTNGAPQNPITGPASSSEAQKNAAPVKSTPVTTTSAHKNSAVAPKHTTSQNNLAKKKKKN